MATTTPRIASIIDVSLPLAQQKPISATTALPRPVMFTKEQVLDTEQHVKQLHSLQMEIHHVSQAHRSHPEQAPVTFKNVTCGTAGAKIYLPHGFGRHADYQVVRWRGATTTVAYILVCDEDDTGVVPGTTNDVLCLRSYAAGKATIRVWPGA